ncbi:MAG: multidrug efflux SMR transporter [Clostridia bacterium]|nr:multidrug efflux SMR transporter [Clostridia bacterium]
MEWLFLLMAIILEVSGTTSMKLSEGFTRIIPSVMLFVFYALSLASLTMALKKIEISMAYAVWSGLGTVIIALVGILYFQESVNFVKVISLGLIIAGVVGLNLSGGMR